MKIIRVFPRKTAYTPDDEYCFFGPPGLFIPPHDAVHVCCVFTWDKNRAVRLANERLAVTDKDVSLGGPAFPFVANQASNFALFNNCAGDFTPGLYVKQGITFTSRGCPNNCPWCFVPKREGKLREIAIQPGNIIQDNNFLACSRTHKDKVFEMLKGQKQVEFRGGLQADSVDDHFVEAVRGLRIKRLWLACDTDSALPKLKQAADKLQRAGFNREKVHCYVLIGLNGIDKDEARLRAVYEAGAMPFAQLYQPEERKEYPKEYKTFARMWSRPAATKAHMEKGTDFRNFNT